MLSLRYPQRLKVRGDNNPDIGGNGSFDFSGIPSITNTTLIWSIDEKSNKTYMQVREDGIRYQIPGLYPNGPQRHRISFDKQCEFEWKVNSKQKHFNGGDNDDTLHIDMDYSHIISDGIPFTFKPSYGDDKINIARQQHSLKLTIIVEPLLQDHDRVVWEHSPRSQFEEIIPYFTLDIASFSKEAIKNITFTSDQNRNLVINFSHNQTITFENNRASRNPYSLLRKSPPQWLPHISFNMNYKLHPSEQIAIGSYEIKKYVQIPTNTESPLGDFGIICRSYQCPTKMTYRLTEIRHYEATNGDDDITLLVPKGTSQTVIFSGLKGNDVLKVDRTGIGAETVRLSEGGTNNIYYGKDLKAEIIIKLDGGEGNNTLIGTPGCRDQFNLYISASENLIINQIIGFEFEGNRHDQFEISNSKLSDLTTYILADEIRLAPKENNYYQLEGLESHQIEALYTDGLAQKYFIHSNGDDLNLSPLGRTFDLLCQQIVPRPGQTLIMHSMLPGAIENIRQTRTINLDHPIVYFNFTNSECYRIDLSDLRITSLDQIRVIKDTVGAALQFPHGTLRFKGIDPYQLCHTDVSQAFVGKDIQFKGQKLDCGISFYNFYFKKFSLDKRVDYILWTIAFLIFGIPISKKMSQISEVQQQVQDNKNQTGCAISSADSKYSDANLSSAKNILSKVIENFRKKMPVKNDFLRLFSPHISDNPNEIVKQCFNFIDDYLREEEDGETLENLDEYQQGKLIIRLTYYTFSKLYCEIGMYKTLREMLDMSTGIEEMFELLSAKQLEAILPAFLFHAKNTDIDSKLNAIPNLNADTIASIKEYHSDFIHLTRNRALRNGTNLTRKQQPKLIELYLQEKLELKQLDEEFPEIEESSSEDSDTNSIGGDKILFQNT